MNVAKIFELSHVEFKILIESFLEENYKIVSVAKFIFENKYISSQDKEIFLDKVLLQRNLSCKLEIFFSAIEYNIGIDKIAAYMCNLKPENSSINDWLRVHCLLNIKLINCSGYIIKNFEFRLNLKLLNSISHLISKNDKLIIDAYIVKNVINFCKEKIYLSLQFLSKDAINALLEENYAKTWFIKKIIKRFKDKLTDATITSLRQILFNIIINMTEYNYWEIKRVLSILNLIQDKNSIPRTILNKLFNARYEIDLNIIKYIFEMENKFLKELVVKDKIDIKLMTREAFDWHLKTMKFNNYILKSFADEIYASIVFSISELQIDRKQVTLFLELYKNCDRVLKRYIGDKLRFLLLEHHSIIEIILKKSELGRGDKGRDYKQYFSIEDRIKINHTLIKVIRTRKYNNRNILNLLYSSLLDFRQFRHAEKYLFNLFNSNFLGIYEGGDLYYNLICDDTKREKYIIKKVKSISKGLINNKFTIAKIYSMIYSIKTSSFFNYNFTLKYFEYEFYLLDTGRIYLDNKMESFILNNNVTIQQKRKLLNKLYSWMPKVFFEVVLFSGYASKVISILDEKLFYKIFFRNNIKYSTEQDIDLIKAIIASGNDKFIDIFLDNYLKQAFDSYSFSLDTFIILESYSVIFTKLSDKKYYDILEQKFARVNLHRFNYLPSTLYCNYICNNIDTVFTKLGSMDFGCMHKVDILSSISKISNFTKMQQAIYINNLAVFIKNSIFKSHSCFLNIIINNLNPIDLNTALNQAVQELIDEHSSGGLTKTKSNKNSIKNIVKKGGVKAAISLSKAMFLFDDGYFEIKKATNNLHDKYLASKLYTVGYVLNKASEQKLPFEMVKLIADSAGLYYPGDDIRTCENNIARGYIKAFI